MPAKTEAPPQFPTGWTPAVAAALAAPFDESLHGWKPKPSKAERDAQVDRQDCGVCGGWHKPCRVHVPFLGHALVTERLNTVVGPGGWSWTLVDLVRDDRGMPLFVVGELTVFATCKGPEVGTPGDQPAGPGDAFKAAISDYISRAAARFGVGLYLKARRLESGVERPQPGLTAARMKREQAEASRTRRSGTAEPRTGRDLLRDVHVSAGDALRLLKAQATTYRDLTVKTLLEADGDRLARIEAHLRAALEREPAAAEVGA